MTTTPHRAPDAIPATTLTQRMIGAAVPYVAVLIGMYALHGAWITILGHSGHHPCHRRLQRRARRPLAAAMT